MIENNNVLKERGMEKKTTNIGDRNGRNKRQRGGIKRRNAIKDKGKDRKRKSNTVKGKGKNKRRERVVKKGGMEKVYNKE